MSNINITAKYDELPLWVRVLIQVVGGVAVGGVYRILRFLETRNILTLVVGILVLCTVIGNVVSWIIDLVCLILYKKYTLFTA